MLIFGSFLDFLQFDDLRYRRICDVLIFIQSLILLFLLKVGGGVVAAAAAEVEADSSDERELVRGHSVDDASAEWQA